AKVIKRYHAPATPCERALAHPAVDKAIKRKLRETRRSLDPVALLAEVREAQAELGKRVDRRAGSAINPSTEALTVARFAQGPGKTWEPGTRRTIRRPPSMRRRRVSRRPSMLAPYVGRMEAWLAAEPHLTAVAIVARLRECEAGSFGDSQLRTLQR